MTDINKKIQKITIIYINETIDIFENTTLQEDKDAILISSNLKSYDDILIFKSSIRKILFKY